MKKPISRQWLWAGCMLCLPLFLQGNMLKGLQVPPVKVKNTFQIERPKPFPEHTQSHITDQVEVIIEHLQLTSQRKYMNLFSRTPVTNQTHWVGQNLPIDPSTDTTRFSYRFPLNPSFAPSPVLSHEDSIELFYILTDTIVTVPPSPPLPMNTYPVRPKMEKQGYGFKMDQELPPPSTWNTPIRPQLNPGVWHNSNSNRNSVQSNFPNIDLDSSTHKPSGNSPHMPPGYAGDYNACAPAATTNSFTWLRQQYDDIDTKLSKSFGEGDSAMRKMLGEFSELMMRQDTSGPNLKDFIRGKLSFIDRYKLPIRVAYQTLDTASRYLSPNTNFDHEALNKRENDPFLPYWSINPEWMHDQIDKKADTELQLIWVDTVHRNNGKIDLIPRHGHAATLETIKRQGSLYRVSIIDDDKQEEPGGNEFAELMTLTISTFPGLEGLPILLEACDERGMCILAGVVVECYDSTIHFNEISGTFFKDSNDDGIYGPQEVPMPGMPLSIYKWNGSSKMLIKRDTTDSEGKYHVDCLAPGKYTIELDSVPPGYMIGNPHQGFQPNKDSDIDPFTLSTDTLHIAKGDGHTGINAAFVPPRHVKLNIKAFLAGPYQAAQGHMNDVLRSFHFFPQLQPYLTSSVTGQAIVTQGTTSSVSPTMLAKGNLGSGSGIVDWVIIELRDPNNPQLLVAARPAILWGNGCITSPDSTTFCMENIGAGNYHVALRHRNHLGVMTGQPLFLSDAVTSIDFTNANTSTFGTDAQKLMSDGKMAMWPGDTNGLGQVDAGDESISWNERNATGYIRGDCNLNGTADSTDRNIIHNHKNKTHQIP